MKKIAKILFLIGMISVMSIMLFACSAAPAKKPDNNPDKKPDVPVEEVTVIKETDKVNELFKDKFTKIKFDNVTFDVKLGKESGTVKVCDVLGKEWKELTSAEGLVVVLVENGNYAIFSRQLEGATSSESLTFTDKESIDEVFSLDTFTFDVFHYFDTKYVDSMKNKVLEHYNANIYNHTVEYTKKAKEEVFSVATTVVENDSKSMSTNILFPLYSINAKITLVDGVLTKIEITNKMVEKCLATVIAEEKSRQEDIVLNFSNFGKTEIFKPSFATSMEKTVITKFYLGNKVVYETEKNIGDVVSNQVINVPEMSDIGTNYKLKEKSSPTINTSFTLNELKNYDFEIILDSATLKNITYVSNKDNVKIPTTYFQNSATINVIDPQLLSIIDGQIFAGWFTDEKLTTKFVGTEATASTKLYGGWKILKNINITAGDIIFPKYSLIFDKSLPKLNVVGNQYIEGFYTDIECKTPFVGASENIDYNIYAKLADMYNVVVDLGAYKLKQTYIDNNIKNCQYLNLGADGKLTIKATFAKIFSNVDLQNILTEVVNNIEIASGKHFKDWKVGTKVFDPSIALTANADITANYRDEVVVGINVGLGSINEKVIFTDNGVVFTKTGNLYTFSLEGMTDATFLNIKNALIASNITAPTNKHFKGLSATDGGVILTEINMPSVATTYFVVYEDDILVTFNTGAYSINVAFATSKNLEKSATSNEYTINVTKFSATIGASFADFVATIATNIEGIPAGTNYKGMSKTATGALETLTATIPTSATTYFAIYGAI